MHNEFTAIVEKDEGWFIAYCPEIPGANGQGHTETSGVTTISGGASRLLTCAASLCA